jgi:hypothetical protein
LALYLAGDLNAALDRLRQAAELAPDVEEYALAVKLMREEIEKRSAAP